MVLRTSQPEDEWLCPRHCWRTETSNPECTGPDNTKKAPYVYQQKVLYTQFIELQRKFQLDEAEPITNMARVAACAFTDSLDKRREKIKVRKTNNKVARAIARIPPSSQHMFGGDHNQLSMSEELCKDLSHCRETLH